MRTGKLKADGCKFVLWERITRKFHTSSVSFAAKEVALKILNPRAYLKDKVAAQQVFHVSESVHGAKRLW